MAKYRVTSHVTICVEMDIMADCHDEAIMEFIKQLDEEYGWANFDTVEVKKVGEE